MDLLIHGKRALVTGASLGIGRAVAAELAREGCDVALVARDAARLGTAAEVAAVVAFLCSERASFVTGEIVNVDGGGTRCI